MTRPRNVLDLDELELPTELDPVRPKGDQIREILESLALRMDEGAPLPSERQLADRYRVARMTVRGEIKKLAADGVLTVRSGSGAYAQDATPQRMSVGHSFSREAHDLGQEPGSIVLEHDVVHVTRRLAELLATPEGTKALRLVRLRTADGTPMCLERSTIPLHTFPGLDDVDFSTASLYQTIRERFGVEPAHVESRASAALPAPSEAHALGISISDPCLVLKILQRDRDGRVIEAGRSIYRGDRYELDVSRSASG